MAKGCVYGKVGCVAKGGMRGGGGACVAGGMCGREHVWQEGVWWACMVVGGQAWQGACMAGAGGEHGRRHGHCSRQYASYWNAFL